MIYLFNESKIKLLTAREAQLIEQQKLLYQVYFLKGILYEEIIDIKSRIEQVKVQLKNYRDYNDWFESCLLYTSPSPRDKRQSRMPSSA